MNQFRSGRVMFGSMGITPAVKGLIIANVVVYVLQFLSNGLVKEYGVFSSSDAIYGFQIWRFFTYMFLHASFLHIGFNMLGLWLFGSQIEAVWGSRSFLTYYFVCGLGAAILYGLFNLTGMGVAITMLGASGAVYGILLAYGMMYPNNIIMVMMIFPMKAKYAVALFGLLALLNSGSGGGVAHLAHLGGMLTGFIFIKLSIPSLGGKGIPFGRDIAGAWHRYNTKRKMKVVPPREKTSSGGSTNTQSPPKSAQQKKIDAILDKISRDGLQSLTDEEQEILRRAGRK